MELLTNIMLKGTINNIIRGLEVEENMKTLMFQAFTALHYPEAITNLIFSLHFPLLKLLKLQTTLKH